MDTLSSNYSLLSARSGKLGYDICFSAVATLGWPRSPVRAHRQRAVVWPARVGSSVPCQASWRNGKEQSEPGPLLCRWTSPPPAPTNRGFREILLEILYCKWNPLELVFTSSARLLCDLSEPGKEGINSIYDGLGGYGQTWVSIKSQLGESDGPVTMGFYWGRSVNGQNGLKCFSFVLLCLALIFTLLSPSCFHLGG